MSGCKFAAEWYSVTAFNSAVLTQYNIFYSMLMFWLVSVILIGHRGVYRLLLHWGDLHLGHIFGSRFLFLAIQVCLHLKHL